MNANDVLPPPRIDSAATPLLFALCISLLLHGALVAWWARSAPADARASGIEADVLRAVIAMPASVGSVTAASEAAATSPTVQPRTRPARPAQAAAPPIPTPLPPMPPLARSEPQAPPANVEVTIVVDADGAIEPLFEDELARTGANLARIALDFETPPAPIVPVEVLRDMPQRRIRSLVRVRDGGQLELLRVDEYDDTLVPAIRAALDNTRAKAPDGSASVADGWTIVVFWFQLTGVVVPR